MHPEFYSAMQIIILRDMREKRHKKNTPRTNVIGISNFTIEYFHPTLHATLIIPLY